MLGSGTSAISVDEKNALHAVDLFMWKTKIRSTQLSYCCLKDHIINTFITYCTEKKSENNRSKGYIKKYVFIHRYKVVPLFNFYSKIDTTDIWRLSHELDVVMTLIDPDTGGITVHV